MEGCTDKLTPKVPTFFSLLGCTVLTLAGCGGPAQGGKAEISESAFYGYLEEAEVNRPEISREALLAIREGRVYRRRVVDQKNRWTLLTIWIERSPQNILHIETMRDETCPACKGTGKRQWSATVMERMPFDTRCLKCDGKGFLPNAVEERKWVLSAGDYLSEDAASAAAPVDAPPEAQRMIDRLPSSDPRERLQALEWLDRHYVRLGVSFQTLTPMLKKARWYESDAKKKIMVWQFWAGKGMENEKARTYYRIYADRKSGQVTKKGFYPGD